jgi:hypothetical protein
MSHSQTNKVKNPSSKRNITKTTHQLCAKNKTLWKHNKLARNNFDKNTQLEIIPQI